MWPMWTIDHRQLSTRSLDSGSYRPAAESRTVAAMTDQRTQRAEAGEPARRSRGSRSNRRGLILALACAAQFMVVLDLAIVNVALPSIQRDLGVGQSTLQWVVIAYGLLFGGFLLLGGRMSDLLGRRRIFLTGVGFFSAASLLAGVAESAGLLITARGLQGFGAALVAPAALSIVAVTFPEGQQRNRALGIFGAVAGTSASVGVIASGLLTDGPGWRWVFFINIPVGLLLLGLAATFLAGERPASGTARLDIAGATTVTGGLLLLVYALSRGADHGWTSGATLVLFAAAVLLLAAFVWIEAASSAPLVPAAAVRNRTLVAANLSAFFAFGAFFSFIFLGSLLMQQVLGYSPTRAGLSWLATSATAFVASGLAGARLVATVGVRRLLATGLSLLAAGMVWLTQVPADADYVTDLLPALLVAGIAIGLCAPSVQIGALSGVDGSASGLASGLVETMREIGGAAGIAAVSSVLVARTGLDGFHAAFTVIGIIAALGAVAAAVGFQRSAAPDEGPAYDVQAPVATATEPARPVLVPADQRYER
jgi:EmrB/QacA subfamily drug resistance transporter